jgi:hypothetical protein
MRVVFRVHATRILLTMLPLVTLLLLAWTQLDAVVNWEQTARILMARPAWQVVPGICAVMAMWVASVTRLVRRTLLSDSLDWLRRQPLNNRAFGLASLGILGPVALPVGVVSWAVYGASLGPFLLWGSVVIAVTPAIAARRATHTAKGLTFGITALFIAHWQPILATPAAVAVFAASLGSVGRAFRHGVTTPGVRSVRSWMPTVPLALVQRDLLGLTRTRPSVWLSSLGTAAFLGACMYFVGVNTGLSVQGNTRVLIVLVAMAGFVGLAGLNEIVDALGPHFDPRGWPVSPRQRALATAISAAILIAPTWAAAAVVSPVTSPFGTLRGMLMLALTATGVSAFVAAGRAGNPGTFAWVLVVWVACVWPGDTWGSAIGLFSLMLTFHHATRAIRAARRARP